MTTTEWVVVVGGLVLGYWIVSVLLPTIGGREDDASRDDSTEETPSDSREM